MSIDVVLSRFSGIVQRIGILPRIGILQLAGISLCVFAFCANSPAGEHASRVVFLGDSLTAGFGLNLDEAYPALIQAKIAALGKNVKVVNAGVSGDTTAGGLARLVWLQRERIDILVIALGANDGMRGLSVDAMKENLRAIITGARKSNPKIEILLAEILSPPNQGEEYSKRFSSIFGELAKEENVPLLPFLLTGVAGIPALNQSDGIHPTAEGQRIMAAHLWQYLEPLIKKLP